jgi:two-component system chemotaxis response regulator CheB
MLDDGTAGLWEIKRQGGIAVVQTPADAQFNQMPNSALANVAVDYQVPVREMGALLISLVGQSVQPLAGRKDAHMPEQTRLTCPDCHGPIERFQFGPITEYKCRVGHAYGPENMLAAHEDAEERALWSAIESLEEGADLADEILARSDGGGNGNGYQGDATTKRRLAKSIRTAIDAANREKHVSITD